MGWSSSQTINKGGITPITPPIFFMKTYISDPNCYKFTKEMIDHFASLGEEKHSIYYDPEMVKWADVVWFETCDNSIHQATQEAMNGETAESTGLKDKKVICRIIDIDAWCGLHNHVDWSYVDDVIFLAPHIKELVEKDINFSQYNIKTHIIPCGVDLNKFTNVQKTYGKNIAWVAERWYGKGVDLFLQFATMLYKTNPEYKIFSVGVWADSCVGGWYKAYIDQFIKDNPMNVEFIDRVENMNDFLSGMDYAISFSKKEAFSYAIAEGMAKGLKPLVHNFYGAKHIYPVKYIWNTLDEAIQMIKEPIEPEEYRRFIETNYSMEKMLRRIDEEVLQIL